MASSTRNLLLFINDPGIAYTYNPNKDSEKALTYHETAYNSADKHFVTIVDHKLLKDSVESAWNTSNIVFESDKLSQDFQRAMKERTLKSLATVLDILRRPTTRCDETVIDYFVKYCEFYITQQKRYEDVLPVIPETSKDFVAQIELSYKPSPNDEEILTYNSRPNDPYANTVRHAHLGHKFGAGGYCNSPHLSVCFNNAEQLKCFEDAIKTRDISKMQRTLQDLESLPAAHNSPELINFIRGYVASAQKEKVVVAQAEPSMRPRP